MGHIHPRRPRDRVALLLRVRGVAANPLRTKEGDTGFPKAAEEVRAQLKAAGVEAKEVSVGGYGVTCRDRLGREHSYAVRGTSTIAPTVTVGDAVWRVINPVSRASGNAKIDTIYFTIYFTARDSNQDRRLPSFTLARGLRGQAQGLRGAALLSYLAVPPS